MAASPQPRSAIFVSCGSRRIEVLTSSGIEGVQSQVESLLGLAPKSYDFFDSCGKVDSPAAFNRAIMSVANAPRMLEVRERPEWQRIRNLEAQMQALLSRELQNGKAFGRFVGLALEEFEQRILDKVDAEIEAAKEEFMTRPTCDVAPPAPTGIHESEMETVKEKFEALEVEMNEHAINASYLHGHLERSVNLLRTEVESFRSLPSKVEALEAEIKEFVTFREATVAELDAIKSSDSAMRIHLESAKQDFTASKATISALEKDFKKLQRFDGSASPDVITRKKLFPTASTSPADEMKWVSEVTEMQSPMLKLRTSDGSQWSDGFGAINLSLSSRKSVNKSKSIHFTSDVGLPFTSSSLRGLNASRSLPSLSPEIM